MIRIQVRLTEEQAAKVKLVAVERRVSMAAVIRDAVNQLPQRDDRRERFERAISALRTSHLRDVGGKRDVSVRHDEYLADIYEADVHER